MNVIERIITASVLCVTAGMLVILMMRGAGADSGQMACVLCLVLAVMAVSVGGTLISDRNRRNRSVTPGEDPGDPDAFIRTYRNSNLYRMTVILVFLAGVFVLLILSLWVGQSRLSISEVLRVFMMHLTGTPLEFGTPDWYNDILIWDVRLPRALVAIIAGAGLAIAGAVMQGAVKNPLADPYTTGISSGAVFGATLFIVIGFTMTGPGQYGIVMNAFLFSLVPALIMIFVSRISNGSPATVILVGTAVSYIFSSFSTLIMMMAEEEALQDAFEWQVGSFAGVSWNTVPLMFFMTAAVSAAVLFTSNRLNIMMAGDDEARSLGLNVDNYRMICLFLLSMMVASIVSYVGMIGFLGLIVPHIVRMFMGSDSRAVLPASAVFGAGTMLLADIISRTLADSAIPVGVVMSFIGGPLFLLLVLKSCREVWSDE